MIFVVIMGGGRVQVLPREWLAALKLVLTPILFNPSLAGLLAVQQVVLVELLVFTDGW